MTITLSKYLPLNNTRKVDLLFEDIRKSGEVPDADQKRMILFWTVDAGIRAYAEREFDKLSNIATEGTNPVFQKVSENGDVELIKTIGDVNSDSTLDNDVATRYQQYAPLDNIATLDRLALKIHNTSKDEKEKVKNWVSTNCSHEYQVSYFLARLAKYSKESEIEEDNRQNNKPVNNSQNEDNAPQIEVPYMGRELLDALHTNNRGTVGFILDRIGQARTKLYYYICSNDYERNAAYNLFVKSYLQEYVVKLSCKAGILTDKECVISEFYMSYCNVSQVPPLSERLSASNDTDDKKYFKERAKAIHDALKCDNYAHAMTILQNTPYRDSWNVMAAFCRKEPRWTISFQRFVDTEVKQYMHLAEKKKKANRSVEESSIISYYHNYRQNVKVKIQQGIGTRQVVDHNEIVRAFFAKIEHYDASRLIIEARTAHKDLSQEEVIRYCFTVFKWKTGDAMQKSYVQQVILPYVMKQLKDNVNLWKEDKDKIALLDATTKIYDLRAVFRKAGYDLTPTLLNEKISAFTIMNKHEFNLDWRWCQFRAGGFTVVCPNDSPIKFSPLDKRMPGVLYSFNYIKEYLNERMPDIKCSAEKGVLTILSPISFDKAILKVAYEKGKQHREEMEIEEKERKPRKITPMRTTFQTSYNRPMSERELRELKSPYINHLISLQEKEYRVIPCVEAMTHRDSESLEPAFLFTIRFGRGLFIAFENVNLARSTYLFKISNPSVYMSAARAIHEFMQSHEVNKRSYLRSSFASMRNRGIIGFECIDHSETYNWKRLLEKKAKEMCP